jgi:hypothetical protein
MRNRREVGGMLGEVVFECYGKIIGKRVLRDGKGYEMTAEMKGTFLGEEFTTTYTCETGLRPDGTGWVEWWGFFNTKGGSGGRYTGNGNGVFKSEGGSVWRGDMCFSNPPGKYARLNGIAVIFENEFDKEGNHHMKAWEWK